MSSAFIFMLLFLFSAPLPARATVMIVNENADAINNNVLCSLREAVKASVIHQAVGGCSAGTGNDSIQFTPGMLIFINTPLTTLASGTNLEINGGNSTTLVPKNDSFTVSAGATLTMVNVATGGAAFCFNTAGTLIIRTSDIRTCQITATAGQTRVESSKATIIYAESGSAALILTNSTFQGGLPFTIVLGTGGATVTGSTFLNAHVAITGIETAGPLRIYRSRFNNQGQGAVATGGMAYVHIENSIIIGETATGIDVTGNTQVTLINNTFVRNNSAVAISPTGSPSVLMINNILSSTNSDCIGVIWPINDGGGNTQRVGGCLITFPLLNPLLNGNYVPLSGSPVIDTGTSAGCPTVDFNNAPRPRDGNGDGVSICERGAIEVQ